MSKCNKGKQSKTVAKKAIGVHVKAKANKAAKAAKAAAKKPAAKK